MAMINAIGATSNYPPLGDVKSALWDAVNLESGQALANAEAQIASLQNLVAELEADNAALKQQNAAVKQESAAMREEVENAKAERAHLKAVLEAANAEIQRRKYEQLPREPDELADSILHYLCYEEVAVPAGSIAQSFSKAVGLVQYHLDVLLERGYVEATMREGIHFPYWSVSKSGRARMYDLGVLE